MLPYGFHGTRFYMRYRVRELLSELAVGIDNAEELKGLVGFYFKNEKGSPVNRLRNVVGDFMASDCQ